VAIVAPAFEGQARAYGQAMQLPVSRVITLPIGEASPDAAESVPKIKVAVGESLEAVVRALREPVARVRS
jgi:hypothetical protein